MREIKFRVWSEDTKSYHDCSDWLVKDLTAKNSGNIVEQFTDLKDRNGKEIYEGDVLWWEHYDGMTGKISETQGEVFWQGKDAAFIVGKWFEPLGYLVDEEEVEIIGNIHEKGESK